MWVADRYYYSTRMLKRIANAYSQLYDGISFREEEVLTNPWRIAEYKADFDRALCYIGRGEWTGELKDFKYFYAYGKLQRIIIADILGIDNDELHRMRFIDIPRLRGYAYYLMTKYLNEGNNVNQNKP